jgi:hypothetical protein
MPNLSRRDLSQHCPPDPAVAGRLFAAVRRFCTSLGMSASAVDDAYRSANNGRSASSGVADEWPDQRLLTQLAAMLNLWYTAADYVDENGTPRPLPMRGDKSAESLASAVGAVSPGALVEAAVSLRILVEENSEGCVKPICRSAIVGGSNQLALAYSAIVVGRLLDALSHNVTEPKPGVPAWFERSVDRACVRNRDVPLFERFIAEQGQYFVDAIDDWLAHHATDGTAADATYIGVSAFAWMRPAYR